MKLFPNDILSWQEPIVYAYGNFQWSRSDTNKRWGGLLFPIVLTTMAIIKQTPWWIFVGLISLFTAIWLLPWMHSRWPFLFPLTGPRVTLFDDRITRQSGRSQISIAIDNISECRVSRRNNKENCYFLLSFTQKNKGFCGYTLGVLTETAILDPAITEQVLSYLRGKEISIVRQ